MPLGTIDFFCRLSIYSSFCLTYPLSNFVEVTSDPLSKISQKKSLHQSSQNLLSKLQDLEYSIVHEDQVSQDESGLCELMV